MFVPGRGGDTGSSAMRSIESVLSASSQESWALVVRTSRASRASSSEYASRIKFKYLSSFSELETFLAQFPLVADYEKCVALVVCEVDSFAKGSGGVSKLGLSESEFAKIRFVCALTSTLQHVLSLVGVTLSAAAFGDEDRTVSALECAYFDEVETCF